MGRLLSHLGGRKHQSRKSLYQGGSVGLYRFMTLEKDPTFGNAEPTPVPAMLNPMARPLTGADIINALDAEIYRQYKDKGGVLAFARDFGVDYNTYRRYLKHERKMSADLLMDSLTFLRVDPVLFFTQLRERLESEG